MAEKTQDITFNVKGKGNAPDFFERTANSLKAMKQVAGGESSLGMFGGMLKGGAAVAGVTAVVTAVGSFADSWRAMSAEERAGGVQRSTFEKVYRSIPIFKQLAETVDSVKMAVTGMDEEMEDANRRSEKLSQQIKNFNAAQVAVKALADGFHDVADAAALANATLGKKGADATRQANAAAYINDLKTLAKMKDDLAAFDFTQMPAAQAQQKRNEMLLSIDVFDSQTKRKYLQSQVEARQALDAEADAIFGAPDKMARAARDREQSIVLKSLGLDAAAARAEINNAADAIALGIREGTKTLQVVQPGWASVIKMLADQSLDLVEANRVRDIARADAAAKFADMAKEGQQFLSRVSIQESLNDVQVAGLQRQAELGDSVAAIEAKRMENAKRFRDEIIKLNDVILNPDASAGQRLAAFLARPLLAQQGQIIDNLIKNGGGIFHGTTAPGDYSPFLTGQAQASREREWVDPMLQVLKDSQKRLDEILKASQGLLSFFKKVPPAIIGLFGTPK